MCRSNSPRMVKVNLTFTIAFLAGILTSLAAAAEIKFPELRTEQLKDLFSMKQLTFNDRVFSVHTGNTENYNWQSGQIETDRQIKLGGMKFFTPEKRAELSSKLRFHWKSADIIVAKPSNFDPTDELMGRYFQQYTWLYTSDPLNEEYFFYFQVIFYLATEHT